MGVWGGEELEGKEKRERSLQTLYESLLGSWEQWEKQAITSNPSPYPDIGNIFLPEPFFSSLSLPRLPSLSLSLPLSLSPSPCISNLILWGKADVTKKGGSVSTGHFLHGKRPFPFPALADFCNLWSSIHEKWVERYFIAPALLQISPK